MKQYVVIGYRWCRKFVFVLLSALLEKNPTELLTKEAPIVFSATRVVIISFAAVMVRRLAMPGIAIGWPEMTLASIIVIALPLVKALQALQPTDVVAFANQIVQKFGAGDVVAQSPPRAGGGDR